MSLKLGKADPHPPGYYLQAASGQPERGPFSAENLRDLAEFQHLTPDSLIRPEDETDARPLHTFPELLPIVFPEQKRFGLKPRAETPDPDADLPAIDVRELFRCAPGETVSEETASAEIENDLETSAPIPSPKTRPTDIQQLLVDNQRLAEARRTAPTQTKRPRFRFGATFLFVRLGLAGLLLILAASLWRTLPPAWALLLSLPLLAFAAALTAGDFLDWMLGWFSARFNRQPPAPVDYSEAAELFRNGNWKAATRAYGKILQTDPHQLRAYREGITAAAAAGDRKQLDAFRTAARKHLGPHDQNLLDGALRRHGLTLLTAPTINPQTPPTPDNQ